MENKIHSYSEIKVKEYASLPRETRDGSSSRLRLRYLKRREPTTGLIRKVFDIRKYTVNQRVALWTRQGIYILPEEIDTVIAILMEAKQDIYGTD